MGFVDQDQGIYASERCIDRSEVLSDTIAIEEDAGSELIDSSSDDGGLIRPIKPPPCPRDAATHSTGHQRCWPIG